MIFIVKVTVYLAFVTALIFAAMFIMAPAVEVLGEWVVWKLRKRLYGKETKG